MKKKVVADDAFGVVEAAIQGLIAPRRFP